MSETHVTRVYVTPAAVLKAIRERRELALIVDRTTEVARVRVSHPLG